MTHSFETQPPRDVSRRTFLQRTSLGLAAAAAVELPRVHVAHGAENFEIKIGLIGCGGRGTGAVLDAIGAATKVDLPGQGLPHRGRGGRGEDREAGHPAWWLWPTCSRIA